MLRSADSKTVQLLKRLFQDQKPQTALQTTGKIERQTLQSKPSDHDHIQILQLPRPPPRAADGTSRPASPAAARHFSPDPRVRSGNSDALCVPEEPQTEGIPENFSICELEFRVDRPERSVSASGAVKRIGTSARPPGLIRTVEADHCFMESVFQRQTTV